MAESLESANFQKVLDETIKWPSVYVFKFIVPRAGLDDLSALFPDTQPVLRDSKNGKYVGFTIEREMSSSAAVMEIYRRAALIPGIMSL